TTSSCVSTEYGQTAFRAPVSSTAAFLSTSRQQRDESNSPSTPPRKNPACPSCRAQSPCPSCDTNHSPQKRHSYPADATSPEKLTASSNAGSDLPSNFHR